MPLATLAHNCCASGTVLNGARNCLRRAGHVAGHDAGIVPLFGVVPFVGVVVLVSFLGGVGVVPLIGVVVFVGSVQFAGRVPLTDMVQFVVEFVPLVGPGIGSTGTGSVQFVLPVVDNVQLVPLVGAVPLIGVVLLTGRVQLTGSVPFTEIVQFVEFVPFLPGMGRTGIGRVLLVVVFVGKVQLLRDSKPVQVPFDGFVLLVEFVWLFAGGMMTGMVTLVVFFGGVMTGVVTLV